MATGEVTHADVDFVALSGLHCVGGSGCDCGCNGGRWGGGVSEGREESCGCEPMLVIEVPAVANHRRHRHQAAE